MIAKGLLGRQITPASIARFYLLNPACVWRHTKSILPVAFSLRPEWCGNFERAAGYPPDTKSTACSLWSGTRGKYLPRGGKLIIILLLVFPLLLAPVWAKLPAYRTWLECYGLLSVCCESAFLVAVLFDAFDNVKHLFLFNLLLDTWLVATLSAAVSIGQSKRQAIAGYCAIASRAFREHLLTGDAAQPAIFHLGLVAARPDPLPYRVNRPIHRNKARLHFAVAGLLAAAVILSGIHVAIQPSSYSFSGRWSDQKEYPIRIDESGKSITAWYLPVHNPAKGVDFPGRVYTGWRLSRNKIWVDFGFSYHGEPCCTGGLRHPLLAFIKIARGRIDWSNDTCWPRD